MTAQKDTSKISLDQVQVIKQFETILADAKIKIIPPQPPEQIVYNPKFQYNITPVPTNIKYTDPVIKPLSMPTDGDFVIKKGYIHLGYGLLKNPDINAGYHYSEQERFDIGMQVSYFAMDNSLKVRDQRMSALDIDLQGGYLAKENTKISASLSYDNGSRGFFHTQYNPSDTTLSPINDRKYNKYNLIAGISNPEPIKFGLNYDVSVNLRNLVLTDESTEDNGFGLSGNIEKLFGKASLFRLSGWYDYSSFVSDNSNYLDAAALRPIIKTRIKDLKIIGGVNLFYGSDGTNGIFPEVRLDYVVAKRYIQAFVAVTQNNHINNFFNLLPYNHYIATRSFQLSNSLAQEYGGGIKGAFSFINYQAAAGYKKIKNQTLFLTSDNLFHFDAILDDVNLIYVSGNLDYQYTDKILLGGRVTYNIYDTKNQTKAYGLTNLETHIFGKLFFAKQKGQITSDLYLANGTPYFYDDKVETTGVLYDLNLGASYKVLKFLSLYIQGQNLLNSKYQRFFGYPIVGTNVLGGLKVTF